MMYLGQFKHVMGATVVHLLLVTLGQGFELLPYDADGLGFNQTYQNIDEYINVLWSGQSLGSGMALNWVDEDFESLALAEGLEYSILSRGIRNNDTMSGLTFPRTTLPSIFKGPWADSNPIYPWHGAAVMTFNPYNGDPSVNQGSYSGIEFIFLNTSKVCAVSVAVSCFDDRGNPACSNLIGKMHIAVNYDYKGYFEDAFPTISQMANADSTQVILVVADPISQIPISNLRIDAMYGYVQREIHLDYLRFLPCEFEEVPRDPAAVTSTKTTATTTTSSQSTVTSTITSTSKTTRTSSSTSSTTMTSSSTFISTTSVVAPETSSTLQSPTDKGIRSTPPSSTTIERLVLTVNTVNDLIKAYEADKSIMSVSECEPPARPSEDGVFCVVEAKCAMQFCVIGNHSNTSSADRSVDLVPSCPQKFHLLQVRSQEWACAAFLNPEPSTYEQPAWQIVGMAVGLAGLLCALFSCCYECRKKLKGEKQPIEPADKIVLGDSTGTNVFATCTYSETEEPQDMSKASDGSS